MSTSHLSNRLLEELHVGERERGEVDAHLETCAACRERLDALARDSAALEADDPPAAFAARVAEAARKVERTRRSRGTFVLRASLAAAAATVIAFVVPRENLRSRGGAVVQTLVERQGALEPLAADRVEAGTRVRFRLELQTAARVCVLHATAGGRYQVLFPSGPAALVSERSLLVPGTFVFTVTGERDYIVVVTAGAETDCGAAEAALATAGAPSQLGPAVGEWLVADVTALPRVIEERRP